MGDIIKEELRKAYKPFFYDGRFIYVPEPLQNGVPVEEGESFKLDENESVSFFSSSDKTKLMIRSWAVDLFAALGFGN